MVPSKSIWRKLTLTAAGLATGLLLAEALLRILGIGFPLLYAPDPWCGTRLLPGAHGWCCQEGQAWVEINHFGFRHGSRTPDKPAGTFRVAVLGDSFVEALQVPAEQNLCTVLERLLAEQPSLRGRPVEVLNFGVSGYGTAQELRMLRHYVWDYQPDLILLAFFLGNDLRNNCRELEPYPVRPFLCPAAGDWQWDDSFRDHADYRRAGSRWVQWKVGLINRVYLLQVLQEGLNRWRQRTAAATATTAGPGIDQDALRPPPTAPWVRAWEVTEELLRLCQREAQEHATELVLVTIGQDLQIDPDPAVRAACARELQVPDLDYAQQRLGRCVQELGLRLIDLSVPMRSHAESQGVYLYGFDSRHPGRGHWNALGQQIAAGYIAAKLGAESLP